ncbi:helix-turn-helix domain-containing protein [Alicyclobacillus sendaiensis]|uniref:helix-turn-helix domain-containing protein n=1 Tax=Alicyclobacillus sendaiensis TaxID=192387 RepID=UPI000B15BEAE
MWNQTTQEILRSGKKIALSDMEARLLQELYARRNHIVPSRHLMQVLWNQAPTACRENLANLIYRLRNHLGERGMIVSAYGEGYMLRVSQDYRSNYF